MKSSTFIFLAAVIATTAVAPAQAAQPVDAKPVAAGPTWEQAIRRLPDSELKQLYAHCGRISDTRPLATDEVLACSVAYDALLTGPFHGDYLALRAWSAQTHGRRPSATRLD